MNAAQQEDARERELRGLMKQIEAIMPNPVTGTARAWFETAIVLNLNNNGGEL